MRRGMAQRGLDEKNGLTDPAAIGQRGPTNRQEMAYIAAAHGMGGLLRP